MDITIESPEQGADTAVAEAPNERPAGKIFDFTDIDTVAERIGIPMIEWSRCQILIAGRMLEKRLVPGGKLIYGHYDGKIDEGTRFHGQSRIPHRWIGLPDGRVLDPVRWVFTGDAGPAIYVSKKKDPAYISSEQQGSESKLAPGVPPPYSTIGAHYSTADNPALSAWISSKMQMGPSGRISLNQIHWLATRSLDRLGDMAEPFYLWLAEQKLLGCVPEKNRQIILDPTSMTRERRRLPKA